MKVTAHIKKKKKEKAQKTEIHKKKEKNII